MKENKPADHRFVTTGEVASAFSVSVVAVKNWIRQGKLRAVRTPGGHFRIPLAEFDRFRTDHRFEEEAATRRLLVVDDEPEIVSLVHEIVGDEPGFVLDAATNGYEGLLKVGSFRPDILLLDLHMPGIDGFEVCRRVKSSPATRATRILAISGVAVEDIDARATESGADAFLAKPFTPSELMAALRRLA